MKRAITPARIRKVNLIQQVLQKLKVIEEAIGRKPNRKPEPNNPSKRI